MRGIIVMLLGLFICIYSIYDSQDGEFTISSKNGGGRTVYQADNPGAYQKSVIGQFALGLVAVGFGYWMWQKDR